MMEKAREESVWRRVQEASTREPETGLMPEQVLLLMEQAQEDARCCRTLAARTRARALARMAERAEANSRELAAVYYIMTGRRPAPRSPHTPPQEPSLRRRYEAEQSAADRLEALSRADSPFTDLLRRQAEEHRENAREILRLLQRML